MSDAQIKYTNTTGSTHETITHLGSDGWKWTKEQVIASIEGETNTFYTMIENVRAVVGVVDDSRNGKYLRTYADGQWNNNLLALPRFPSNWTGKS